MRTDQKTVTFTRPFSLSGVGGLQPAGTHIPADPSPGQTRHFVAVDPEELVAVLEDNSNDDDTGPEAMDSAARRPGGSSAVDSPRTTIRIVLRYGIWQLTRSGSFYGDYSTRQEAFDAGRGIADAAAARGERIDVELDGDSLSP